MFDEETLLNNPHCIRGREHAKEAHGDEDTIRGDCDVCMECVEDFLRSIGIPLELAAQFGDEHLASLAQHILKRKARLTSNSEVDPDEWTH